MLKGTKQADVIVRLGGKDQIKGRKGDDLVCAGAGKDHVVGGAGDDDLFGEALSVQPRTKRRGHPVSR